jgi:hypothetical protein
MGGLFSSPAPSPTPTQIPVSVSSVSRMDTGELNLIRQDIGALRDSISQIRTGYLPVSRADDITKLQSNYNTLQQAIDDLQRTQTQQSTSFSKLQQSMNQLSSMYSTAPVGPSSMFYINPFTNARRIDLQLAIQEPTQGCLPDSTQGSQYLLYAPEQKLNELMSLTANQIMYIINKTPNEILPFVYKLSGLNPSSKQPILQQLASVSPDGNEVFQDISPGSSTYTTILSILDSKNYGYVLQPCVETYAKTTVPRFLSMNSSAPVFRKAVIGRTHRYS